MATAELKQPQPAGIKIDAKQAAKLSLAYFNDLFATSIYSNVALEEVELLEEEKCWSITLGFDETIHVKASSPSPLISAMNIFNPGTIRKFKIFKVDVKTGKVISMKIRKLE